MEASEYAAWTIDTPLDCEECIADTPRYRHQLRLKEQHISHIESRLSRVLKACNEMLKQSDKYGDSVLGFVDALEVLAGDAAYAHTDAMGTSVGKFSRVLRHLETHRNMLMQQAKTTIAQSMEDFIVVELRAARDAGKIYHRLSDELDSCRAKYASTAKSKPHECRDAEQLLRATEGVFFHSALNYAYQVNVLLSREHAIIIERLVAFMLAVNTFYVQGTDAVNDIEPTLKRCSKEMSEAAVQLKAAKREMETKHAAAEMRLRKRPAIGIDKDVPPILREGFLFKRESGSKSWSWNYFVLRGGALLCQPRETSAREVAKGKRSVLAPMIPDLRLCTTHADASGSVDRQYCFELISTHKRWVLQATSANARDYWVAGINEAVEEALNSGKRPERSSSATSSGASSELHTPQAGEVARPEVAARMAAVRLVAGNDRCADCGAPDPTWCSINLGVTLCIECSGIHRSFGVHVSKVRSLSLDDMSDGVATVMQAIGNDKSNDLYFGLIGRETAEGLRPKPEDDRSEKSEWIRQKYMDRAFMAPTEKAAVEAELLKAAEAGDLLGCVTNLTSSASVNCTPRGVGTDTPLLAAVGGRHLAATEYLLLNGADINVRSGPKSWSALHRAAHNGDVDMATTLLQYKASLDESDIDGNTPLALAVASASGDVVTLLRLASLDRKGDEAIGIAISDFHAARRNSASK